MFIFLGTVLKFGDLLGYGFLATDAEFQLSIFKIVPARQKKPTGTWGVNTTFIVLGLFMILKVNELNTTCPYCHQVPRTDQEEFNNNFKRLTL